MILYLSLTVKGGFYAKSFVCGNCGFVGKPKSKVKGSIILEILRWLFCILPGVIYSLWRMTTRYKACPSCGAPNMIPADSPKGKKIIEEQDSKFD